MLYIIDVKMLKIIFFIVWTIYYHFMYLSWCVCVYTCDVRMIKLKMMEGGERIYLALYCAD